ncbi:MAG: efflux RND transporter periplasmic adaptor subunit [Deltaproteobacteria bacterium]|nr:efflux RND transporter periplasmic adaptor subunit [Deltaproteobacteria bacterium]
MTGVACGGGRNEPAPPPVVTLGPEDIAVVAVTKLEAGPAISGTLQPRLVATVRAEVAGPVRQVHADRGTVVEEGQILVVLDDTALTDQVRAARSQVRSARNALEVAILEEQRSRRLVRAGGLAQRDLDRAVAQVQVQRAQLADARARLVSAQQQLERTRVRAPFAGVLSERQVNQGDIAQVGTALFTVVDPSTMRLEALVPAEGLDKLRPGAPVDFQVTGFGERLFRGEIERVQPVVDRPTGQVKVDIAIPNLGGGLLGGLSAQGRVALRSVEALAAPVDTVDFSTSPPSVLRVREGAIEQLQVEPGLRDEVTQRVELRRGVSAGDELVRESARGAVSPGTRVQIQRQEQLRARTGPARRR